jgi:hypothetical protein
MPPLIRAGVYGKYNEILMGWKQERPANHLVTQNYEGKKIKLNIIKY